MALKETTIIKIYKVKKVVDGDSVIEVAKEYRCVEEIDKELKTDKYYALLSFSLNSLTPTKIEAISKDKTKILSLFEKKKNEFSQEAPIKEEGPNYALFENERELWILEGEGEPTDNKVIYPVISETDTFNLEFVFKDKLEATKFIQGIVEEAERIGQKVEIYNVIEAVINDGSWYRVFEEKLI